MGLFEQNVCFVYESYLEKMETLFVCSSSSNQLKETCDSSIL